MSFWQKFGLIICLLTTAITVGVFGFDLHLVMSGQESISGRVWDEFAAWRQGQGSFPWRLVWLPGLMSLAPIGLLIHFVAPSPKKSTQ